MSVLLLASLLLAQAPETHGLSESQLRRKTPVVAVVERAGPAVVNIATEVGGPSNPFARQRERGEDWSQFFGQQPRPRQQSLGSGVIIDASGLVLTNEHVVSESTDITVTLEDRRTFAADVVGADPAFDIAVLKLRGAKDLPAAKLGTSEDLMPGESVVAIGNPYGLANTVTTGVVSALHRSIEAREKVYEDFIQTDAAINPGNSGGALLNIEGELIGINTAIHGSGQGIGFAIPITKAKAVIDEVMRYGEVRPVYSGLFVSGASAPGARVISVAPDGPAAEAGIMAGDLIIDVGGQEVRSGRAYRHMERGIVPGTKAKVTVKRGEATAAKNVVLTMSLRELVPARATELGKLRLGLGVSESRGHLLIGNVDPRSQAAQVGIKKGDLLLALGGRRANSQKDFDTLCAAMWDAEAVTAVIGRGGRAYYVTLGMADAL